MVPVLINMMHFLKHWHAGAEVEETDLELLFMQKIDN